MRGRSRVLSAVALMLALTACGGEGSDADAGGSVRTLPPSSGSAAPSSSPGAPPATGAPPGAGEEPNERGNIPLQVGEMVDIRATDDPDAPTVLSFGIDEFDLNPECDSGVEQAPASRNYLAFRMRVETTPDYDPRALTTFQEFDFRVLGPDGQAIPDVIGNSQTCLKPDALIANKRLGPGQEYSGWLVLDVPVYSGTLVYAPHGGSTGWEWAWKF